MDEKQQLVSAVPETGEIPYEELRLAMITANQKKALNRFHDMRRKGELVVRLENQNGELKMFVSRPQAG